MSGFVFRDERDSVPAHTLRDLQVDLCIPLSRTSYGDRRGARASPEARVRGWLGVLGRWEKDYRRFAILESMRGGFRVGTRHWALFICCRISIGIWRSVQRIRAAGFEAKLDTPKYSEFARMTIEEFERRVNVFADRCEYSRDFRPQQAAAKAMRIVSDPHAQKSISHRYISKVLHVSRHEAAWLSDRVWTRRGSGWQPESGDEIQGTVSRFQKQVERRQALQNLASEFPSCLPTLAQFVGLLQDRGISASTFTIHADLKALGIRTGREHRVLKAAG